MTDRTTTRDVIANETIQPGEEIEFPAYTNQKVGRQVQIVSEKFKYNVPWTSYDHTKR